MNVFVLNFILILLIYSINTIGYNYFKNTMKFIAEIKYFINIMIKNDIYV